MNYKFIIHKVLAIKAGFYPIHQFLFCLGDRAHAVSLKAEITFTEMLSPELIIVTMFQDRPFLYLSGLEPGDELVREKKLRETEEDEAGSRPHAAAGHDYAEENTLWR